MADCINIRVAHLADRDDVINVINAVAAERRHLHTDQYRPTPIWEQTLLQGQDVANGLLLLVVTDEERIVGFGRLTTDQVIDPSRTTGNIGLALLPAYRHRSIGSILLGSLITWAPQLGFSQLNAAILAHNTASLRLFLDAGFCELQRREVQLSYMDIPVEEVIVGLLLDDKEASCSSIEKSRLNASRRSWTK